MSDKRQAEVNIATVAIAAIRFLTPMLVSVLVWIGLQVNNTLQDVVHEVQEMRVLMATYTANQEEFRLKLADHEARLRAGKL